MATRRTRRSITTFVALALISIILIAFSGQASSGVIGGLKSIGAAIVSPVVSVVDAITKPIGNLFAGGLMLSLLAALVIWKLGPAPIGAALSVPFTVMWKVFDMAIGAIQAFIFALLTILYFDTAMAEDDAH